MNIVLAGPLPPPMGGDTRHFATLVADLDANAEYDVTLINTSRAGRFDDRMSNVKAALHTAVTLMAKAPRADLVSFQSSDRAMVMFGPIVATICRLWRTPYVFRLFGGSFGDFYRSAGRIQQFVIRRFILSAPTVLLQTHRQIGQLEANSSGRLEWFSTYIELPPDHDRRLAGALAQRTGVCSRFVFLGHLWESKGIELILESSADLPADITIDVYGPEDEYSGDEIDRRGNGRVTYRGFLTHDEVYQRLWEYDCLLLPTSHPGEGYPGVIAEAHAHGMPVIATRWLAIPEIVDDDCGVLIEPRDASGLTEAMLALHADPDRWRRLCEGASGRIANFDHQRWARKFESLCDELVASRT